MLCDVCMNEYIVEMKILCVCTTYYYIIILFFCSVFCNNKTICNILLFNHFENRNKKETRNYKQQIITILKQIIYLCNI